MEAIYNFLKILNEIVALEKSLGLFYVVDVIVLKLGVKKGSLKVVLFYKEVIPGVNGYKQPKAYNVSNYNVEILYIPGAYLKVTTDYPAYSGRYNTSSRFHLLIKDLLTREDLHTSLPLHEDEDSTVLKTV